VTFVSITRNSLEANGTLLHLLMSEEMTRSRDYGDDEKSAGPIMLQGAKHDRNQVKASMPNRRRSGFDGSTSSVKA